MELDLILQTTGAIGIIIFYFILAKLSRRMGEGLMLAPYYRWDYIACFIVLLTIPLHAYVHIRYEAQHSGSPLDLEALYISLLLLSTVIVILVSYRYWWWLKDEILKRVL